MRAVERLMSLLECFTRDAPSLPLHVVAERTGLPRPTALHLPAALTELGWLVRQADSEYCRSMKAVDLAGRVTAMVDVRGVTGPCMRVIAARTGETIALNRIAGLGRICIEAVDSASDRASVMRVGDRAPLRSGRARGRRRPSPRRRWWRPPSRRCCRAAAAHRAAPRWRGFTQTALRSCAAK